MRPADYSDASSPDMTGKPADIKTRREGDSVTVPSPESSTFRRLTSSMPRFVTLRKPRLVG